MRKRWMRKRVLGVLLAGILLLTGCLTGCAGPAVSGSGEAGGSEETRQDAQLSEASEGTDAAGRAGTDGTDEEGSTEEEYVTEGTEEYRGFILDNVFHSREQGEIHFNLYVPESYDGSEPYAAFFTLPGYEGLYFQGVGENLYNENFGFSARDYNDRMIIVAPQLSDWGMTSANQTIALVEYILSHYNIDPDQVYGERYSGGGETMSLVMGMRPDLFTAYLHCSFQWDGAFAPVAESRGVRSQHGGGNLFAEDEEIMGWLFGRTSFM